MTEGCIALLEHQRMLWGPFEDIRWAITQRCRLFIKAKRSNNDEDWRAYRTYRNLVTTKIRDRKLE